MKQIEIEDDASELIRHLIKKIIGMDNISHTYVSHVKNSLRRRYALLGYTSLKLYLRFVLKDDLEYAFFVSSLTIHYTEWFRERGQFNFLNTVINKYYKGVSFFKVLILGCSSGEEVYSLAFVLESLRKQKIFDYIIEAIDIDPISISIASQAKYGISNINKIPKEYVADYIEKNSHATYFQIKDKLRKKIIFRVLNILKLKSVIESKYHLIFCRNILIYFSEEQINSLLKEIRDLLASNGLLFLGLSEIIEANMIGFKDIGNAIYAKLEDTGKNGLNIKTLVLSDSDEIKNKLSRGIPHKFSSIKDRIFATTTVSDGFFKDAILIGILDERMLFERDGRALDSFLKKISSSRYKKLIGISRNTKSSENIRKYVDEVVTIDLLVKTYLSLIEMLAKYLDIKEKQKPLRVNDKYEFVLIGASTGGPDTVNRLLAGLIKSPPIILVVHMNEKHRASYAHTLQSKVFLQVEIIKDKCLLQPNTIYLTDCNMHIEIYEAKNSIYARLSDDLDYKGHKPSVNSLFHSAAKIESMRCLAILLTGMGDDGVNGLMELLQKGNATTIAQGPLTSTVFGMPMRAIDIGAAQYIMELDEIHEKLQHIS